MQVGEFVEVSNNSKTDPCAWLGMVDKLGSKIKAGLLKVGLLSFPAACLLCDLGQDFKYHNRSNSCEKVQGGISFGQQHVL